MRTERLAEGARPVSGAVALSLPAAAGLFSGAAVIAASDMPVKWAAALAGAFALALFLIVARGRREKTLFVLLALLFPLDLDVMLFIAEEHTGGANSLRISAFFVVLLMLLVPWLRSVLSGKRGIRFFPWISVPFALYFLVAAASVFRADEPVLGLFQLIQFLQSYLAFLYIANNLRTEGDLSVLVWALSLVLAFQGAVALAQNYTSLPLNFQVLGGAEDTMLDTVAGEEIKRVSGFFGHPILLANFVLFSLPAVTVLVALAGGLWRHLWGAVSVALGAAAMVLSFSRGSLVGLAIAGAVLALFLVKKRVLSRERLLLLSFFAIIAVLTVLLWKGESIYLRFTEGVEGPVLVRYELAEIAARMSMDNPYLGVGLNNFTGVIPDYERLTEFVPGFRHPVHNIYLLEFAETGVAGGLLFISLMLCILRVGFGAVNRGTAMARYAAAALTSSLAAFMVTGLMDWSYRVPLMNTIFWVCLGVIGAIYAGSVEAEGAGKGADGRAY